MGAVAAPILAGLGLQWEDMTTWAAFGDALRQAVMNPVIVVSVVVSLWGIINDPTTKGVSDSVLTGFICWLSAWDTTWQVFAGAAIQRHPLASYLGAGGFVVCGNCQQKICSLKRFMFLHREAWGFFIAFMIPCWRGKRQMKEGTKTT